MQEWSPENENGEPVVTSEDPQQGGLSRTGVLDEERGGGEERKVLDVDDDVEGGRSAVSETRRSQLRRVAGWRRGGEAKAKV